MRDQKPYPTQATRGWAYWFLAALLAAPAAQARDYVPQGRCGGYDRVAIASPAGTCVALLADEHQGLRAPRRILEIAPGKFWLIDMGSWTPKQGRLLELTLPLAPINPNDNAPALRAQTRVLLDKLDRPLGLAKGPDGKVYVGEADKVWRTAIPSDGQLPVAETVLASLPADGAHPLKELTFGLDGSLYVNIGASSDACRDNDGKLPLPCPEREGAQPRAAVWRAILIAPGSSAHTPVKQFTPFATGLRNSVALAVLPDGKAAGTVWQGENNVDYRDAQYPPEELNELIQGGDYGWPYCLARQRAARGYEGRADCSTTRAPHMLWPAHAAPLHLLATPLASPFKGQLLVAWHGPQGHKVVGFARQADGRPGGKAIEWLTGWTAHKGLRPLGRPTGLALDHAGRLLVVEDYNRSVLMLLPDSSPPKAAK